VNAFDTFIPATDGCRLAARIWLPEGAEQSSVPAILEYIPYRKNDWTAPRDASRHPWYAAHGYAAVRVDLRGSGDSEGVLTDEYLPLELSDGCDVIAWLAAQPWCNGAVGMIGKSWGGFNGLQIAALRPPALRAIVTVCSTDDRYADDVHYMGGCLMGSDMLPWASTMLAFNARPPDPATWGDRWRDLWLERLAGSPPFVEEWLRHPRRDDYWRHGSVCEDYGAIECAVYAVGGLADPYRNAIPRLLEGLRCPRKGLIGPWAHTYPDEGRPGPAIGFLQETERFFAHWLKGQHNGVMDGPMLRVYLQEPAPPQTAYAERAGRWVGEEWPSARIAVREIAFPGPARSITGSQSHGVLAGTFVAWGEPADLPPDQRGEDALCLVHESAPLTERTEVVGLPEVELELSVDRPAALVAVRLCDVAEDGASLQVARGVLNLAHRAGHDHVLPCVPGERFRVVVPLSFTAHAFVPGRRIRIAMSPTWWPHAWPSPEPVRMTVHAATLRLPERPPDPADVELEPFLPPEQAPPLRMEHLGGFPSTRVVERDLATGVTRVVYHADWGSRRLLVDAGLECEDWNTDTFEIRDGEPLSARVTCEWEVAVGREAWRTRIRTWSELTADATTFMTVNRVQAFEGDELVFERERTFTAPRDGS
jgi:putative CocE/NonD family hydrolase